MQRADLAALRLALKHEGFALDLALDAFGKLPGKFALRSLDLHGAVGRQVHLHLGGKRDGFVADA